MYLFQHAAHSLNTLNKRIHLGMCIIKSETGSACPFYAQAMHERLGTMMTRTHSYTQSVKQGAHVQMMDVAHLEGEHSIMMLHTGRTIDVHTLYLTHLLHGITGKFPLVSLNILHP